MVVLFYVRAIIHSLDATSKNTLGFGRNGNFEKTFFRTYFKKYG